MNRPNNSNRATSARTSDDADVSAVEKADVEIGATIAEKRDHPAAKAAAEASEIGDQGPLYVISAGLFIAGLVTRDRRVTMSGISMIAAVGLTDVTKRIAKRLVRRTRPHVFLDSGRYETDAGGSKQKPEQSFPSGHTACSVAAARALSRQFPGPGAAAGVAATAIGISRIAKAAHWPLDVLAGGAIGLASEAITARLVELLNPKINRLLDSFDDLQRSPATRGYYWMKRIVIG